MERRRMENAALRELVDALKTVIDTRDDLWSLGVFDRVLRPRKYRQVISCYDAARADLRNAIQAVVASSKSAEQSQGQRHGRSSDLSSRISVEEFEYLLGKHDLEKRLPKKNAPDRPSIRGILQEDIL